MKYISDRTQRLSGFISGSTMKNSIGLIFLGTTLISMPSLAHNDLEKAKRLFIDKQYKATAEHEEV